MTLDKSLPLVLIGWVSGISQVSALIYRTPLILLLMTKSKVYDFYLARVAGAILRLDWQSQESKVTRVVEKRIV